MKPWQRGFLDSHRLPDSYLSIAERFFEPLAGLIAAHRKQRGSTLRVALNGSQGSGKSTLGEYLCVCLAEEYGFSAVALSLDDFYLTRAERLVLADKVHPLLKTRGVPGTHDVTLLRDVLQALGQAAEEPVLVPRFDKSTDDRAPQEAWTRCNAPVDVIILEGWCLGARSELPDALAAPINTLEREEDPDSQWRNYSNQQLKDQYESLYDALDFWIMLAAPGFEQVLRWRAEQEQKLRDAVGGQGDGLMDDAALSRFVQHFERYTRQCLSDLPERADVLLRMDADRKIIGAKGLEAGA
ncbi:hypothetical protein [Congregibacter sp.]|uniref:hypothetical protein n=1 Tax=Congregibacter sp. TaxID=2744308 RepID=UPI003F6C8091